MSKILINLITCSSILFMYNSPSQAKSIREIGDALKLVVPAYALGLTMAEDGYEGASQFALSLISSQLTIEGLKKITKRKRPDYVEGDKRDSFPSGHSGSAFSGATFIHKRYGLKQAIIPYIGATFVAYSRVESNRHHIEDVVGGALVSAFYTWVFVDKFPNTSLSVDSDGVVLKYKKAF